MSATPPDLPDSDTPLDPLIVQTLREHGDSLAPDGMSRERIWKKIQTGLAGNEASSWINRICSFLQSPKHWGPVVALALVVAIGMPMLLNQQSGPDWSNTEFKGLPTVHLSNHQRVTFLAELQHRNIPFRNMPQLGQATIMIEPTPTSPLDRDFLQKWQIPVADKPCLVIFE